jgi:hypothetical protein
MSLLHPNLNSLNQFSSFYKNHAEELLQCFVEQVLKTVPIEISITNSDDKIYSAVSFSDELNRIFIELKYSGENFIITIFEVSGDIEEAKFEFRFTEESSLWKKIPEGLIDMMQEVEFNHEPMSYTPNSLDK